MTFELNDGQTCQTPPYGYTRHTYDVRADIKEIEVSLNPEGSGYSGDNWIQQIVFYHRDGSVAKLGPERAKGRIEKISVLEDEHLIGAVVDTSASYSQGITFIFIKS